MTLRALVKLFITKPHSMVICLIKVRISYRDLSSQADPKMLGDFIAGSPGEMNDSERF